MFVAKLHSCILLMQINKLSGDSHKDSTLVTEYVIPPLNTLGDNFPQKRSLECGSCRFLPKFRASSGASFFRAKALKYKTGALDLILKTIAI